MARYREKRNSGKKYFSKTAGNTQSINTQRSPMRGGFRI